MPHLTPAYQKFLQVVNDLSNRTKYGRAARLYDFIANVGSFGAIPHLKRLHLLECKAASSLLYVGSGTADEAILAAMHGHKVTILDSSKRMLEIASLNARKKGVERQISFLHNDFFIHSTSEKYDGIALHFFLDVFDLSTVYEILKKCTSHLAPHGKIFIADYAVCNGPFPIRCAQWCYQQGGALSCAILAKQPWLTIEDYEKACSFSGIQIERTRHIGIPHFGRSWFLLIVGQPKTSLIEQQEVSSAHSNTLL